MPCEVQRVDDGGKAILGHLGLEFDVMGIPGHTLGHIAYVGHGALFCGDTLFSAGCGRLFEGTADQMHTSLDRLAALPAETAVYCGHEYTLSNLRFASAVEPGNREISDELESVRQRRERDEITLPSTVERERRINPFLRCRTDAVRGAAERHVGRALADSTEVFAAVRAWKDGFR
jgi:hydroxyacylglutathione hydrolase